MGRFIATSPRILNLSMPLLFTCPHCQTQTLVEDRYSGHAGRCISCGHSIQVPFFANDTPLAGASVLRAQGEQTWVRRAIALSLGAVTVIGLLAGLFTYGLPAFEEFRQMQQRVGTMRNLERISAALAAYASDHGTYPPAIIRDSAGTPMHSWRVLLLPYLNQNDLHNRYDFNKPWNAPENSLLQAEIPDVYFAQSSLGGTTSEATYQLVTGPNTLNPTSGPLSPNGYTDDPAKTALVVEGFGGVNNLVPTGSWLEPTELEISKMTGQIGAKPGVEIGGVTEGGVAIATADGRVHFLDQNMTPDVVLAILTANGSEPLADDVLD